MQGIPRIRNTNKLQVKEWGQTYHEAQGDTSRSGLCRDGMKQPSDKNMLLEREDILWGYRDQSMRKA